MADDINVAKSTKSISHRDIKRIKKIICNAGKLVLEHFGHVSIEHKKNKMKLGLGMVADEEVTIADATSEEYIVAQLTKYFPEDNIDGEEQGMRDKHAARTWYVDPVDGTSNFARNSPLFGISIGLAEDGKAIFGALYFPLFEELYIGVNCGEEQERYATRNGKHIRVSERELNDALYHTHLTWKKREYGYHPKLQEKVHHIRVLNCTTYCLADIARGSAEIYTHHNSLVDNVAGVAIVQAAGGRVTDFDGKEWSTASKTFLVTNAALHDEVVKILQSDARWRSHSANSTEKKKKKKTKKTTPAKSKIKK